MHTKIRWEKENDMNVLIIMNSTNVKLGGGIIQIILNYKKELDKKDISQTYAINCIENTNIPQLLNGRNSKFIQLPNKKEHLIKYCLELYRLMKDNKFEVVHVHGNSANMLIELLIAKLNKIPCRIAHSHNSTCKHKLINKILKPLFKKTYTKALACSNIAGEWLFGKNNFSILNNAIDLTKFCFSESIRETYRNKFKVNKETKIIGNVGNLNEQKNQEFLLRVFERYNKINPNSLLIIIGEGINKNKLISLSEELKINDSVKFLGLKTDVNCWMQAMDLFVLPSKWEGFGMVLIEAQAAGLPVLSSNVVPDTVKVNKDVYLLDLNKNSLSQWANNISELIEKPIDRSIDTKKFKEYDINVQSEKLLKYYGINN